MKCDVCGKEMEKGRKVRLKRWEEKEICEECVEMYRGWMGEWMRKECWLE